jgi:hypothetical protein
MILDLNDSFAIVIYSIIVTTNVFLIKIREIIPSPSLKWEENKQIK